MEMMWQIFVCMLFEHNKHNIYIDGWFDSVYSILTCGVGTSMLGLATLFSLRLPPSDRITLDDDSFDGKLSLEFFISYTDLIISSSARSSCESSDPTSTNRLPRKIKHLKWSKMIYIQWNTAH